MSFTAALSTGVLPRAPVQVGIRSIQPAKNLRTSIIMRAKIEEINTDDTPGVSTLLDRDFKYVIFDKARSKHFQSKMQSQKPQTI